MVTVYAWPPTALRPSLWSEAVATKEEAEQRVVTLSSFIESGAWTPTLAPRRSFLSPPDR